LVTKIDNDRIAESVGFYTEEETTRHSNQPLTFHYNPQKTLVIGGYPDFPTDIGACITWIVPTLFTWYIGKNWKPSYPTNIAASEIISDGVKAELQSLSFNNPEFQAVGIAKEPAMAFCLAYTKLLDQKEKLAKRN